jgi:hypothetical protein
MEPAFSFILENFLKNHNQNDVNTKNRIQATEDNGGKREQQRRTKIQENLCGSQIFLCGPLWANIS